MNYDILNLVPFISLGCIFIFVCYFVFLFIKKSFIKKRLVCPGCKFKMTFHKQIIHGCDISYWECERCGECHDEF